MGEDEVDLERLQRLHAAIGRYDASAKIAGILSQYRAATDPGERAVLLEELVTQSQALDERTPEHVFAEAVREEMTRLTSSVLSSDPAPGD